MRSDGASGGPVGSAPQVRTAVGALWPELRRRLLATRASGPGRPVLVGIDGRSGSGKTDLARSLEASVREVGLGCAVMHLDDLYPGWSGLAAALGPLCEDVVGPLTRGEPATYTSWDWDGSRPGPRRTVPPRDVVVVEGVGVLASACADLLDVRLWLEAPAGVRRERALGRDGDVFAPHWEQWARQERALFAGRAPSRADVVADTVTGTVRWSTLDA